MQSCQGGEPHKSILLEKQGIERVENERFVLGFLKLRRRRLQTVDVIKRLRSQTARRHPGSTYKDTGAVFVGGPRVPILRLCTHQHANLDT